MIADSPPCELEGVAISGVVLDAFGTLAAISENRRPFGRLWELAGRGGGPKEEYAKAVMTASYSLSDAAHHFFPWMQEEDLRRLEDEMALELASIRLFPEVMRNAQ